MQGHGKKEHPSFDGITLYAVRKELASCLEGIRISRIYHPEPHLITLELREHTLLISTHPVYGRVHLTCQKRANPPTPSPFCMLLRKRLEGGRITQFAQDGTERVLRVHVRTRRDEEEEEYVLIAEVMGKHSNLILTNQEGRIIDAMSRLAASVNRYREVLPGRSYIPPPATGKVPLLTPDGLPNPDLETDLKRVWSGLQAGPSEAGDKPLWLLLLETVEGVGRANAKAIVREAGLEPETPAGVAGKSVFDLLATTLCRLAGDLWEGAPPPCWKEPTSGGTTINHLLDDEFRQAEMLGRLASERQQLRQAVSTALSRARRRLVAQEEEEREAALAEEYRTAGELLMSQLHLVEPGDTSVELTDYYNPDQGTRKVALDPALSPVANAQAYFKKYSRARRVGDAAAEKVRQTRDEIAYLETVEASLETAETLSDLRGIREELRESGFLRADRPLKTKPGKQARRRKGVSKQTGGERVSPGFLTVQSSENLKIMVGKNNKQNDYLTLRLASPGDLWLHAKGIPGSHVIVTLPYHPKNLEDISEKTLLEAATLAAYYSKGRHATKVEVDYTLRKHVHKPRGAKPGMVTYTDYRSISVDPSAALRLLGLTPPA